jgi:G3E family GTPase
VTDFILLAGFLGSGKTTLLADFLRHPEAADTAVIVNEAGVIDIDGAVIAESAGDLPMALLANGCVCCSIANDLLYTIEALIGAREAAGGPPFRRIVLELSGLARPGPVIRSLGELAPLGLRVSVVTLCDASAPPFGDAVLETAAAQIAAAGTLVLSKLDLADPAPLAARLAGINPLAGVVIEPDPARRALLAFTAPPAMGVVEGPSVGHPRIAVMHAAVGDLPLSAILDWLDNLSGLAGDKLLRLKGVIRPTDVARPLLFQAVGTAFSQPRWFEGAADEGFVIIAHDLAAADILAMQPDFPVVLTTSPTGPFAAPERKTRLAAT